jgi:hypothetical protein
VRVRAGALARLFASVRVRAPSRPARVRAGASVR